MEISKPLVTQAYSQGKKAISDGPKSTPQVEETMGEAAENFAAILTKSEDTAKAAMVGDADPAALVKALADSKMAVEAVVAVRDKVVEAYKDILRMPV